MLTVAVCPAAIRRGGGSPPAWSLALPPTDLQVTITNGTGGYLSNTLLALTTSFSLPPGHWWLIFYPTMYFDPYGQYGRQPASTSNGSVGQWINPGGGFGGGTAWQGWNTLWPEPPYPYDIAFRLEALAGLRVDSTGDGGDANLTDGVCATAGGECTLRAAIQQANYDGGGTILFTGMAGVPTIPVGSELLVLAAPITIDGTTAAGRRVELDGSLVTGGSGLTLAGGSSVIKGLVINRFGDHGIVVESSGNRIGGLSGAQGNMVAFNWVGVAILESTTGNAILGNDIWDNYDLGIDLEGDGVTLNDPLDADSEANQFQNYPELWWVVTGPPSASTVISGTLNSTPLTSFGIELFYSKLPDLSGHGEGQHYLGSGEVSTDSGGWATFTITVPRTIPAASFVTATATDPNGNTSEFSTWRVAIPETMIVIEPGQGGTLIYTDTSALSTTIEVPIGAVSETIILALQPMAAPTEPPLPGLRSGDETFDLSAYLGNDVLEGYEFLKPLTVTLRYSDADVFGILESGLRLYYWDGSTWQDAADTCSPPSTYFLDTVNNVMQVAICHLTEWNIQGPDMFPWKVNLPLVLRGF